MTVHSFDKPLKGAWAAALLLSVAWTMAYADRMLPFLFMEPIKASFKVDDTQVALLTGFSFAMSMAIFALPLSWLADRSNRARLLTAAIAGWCLTTIGCGFAQNFWVLFVLRMGVGLAEAALQPAAYSLLADLFPPRFVTRPLGLMALSALLGQVLALNGGGLLYAGFTRLTQHSAGAALMEPWRLTMIAFGAIGLIVAVASIWLLKEPRERSVSSPSTATAPAVSFPSYLRRSAFFYGPFVASMCVFVLYDRGNGAWMAPFFSRTYGWTIGQIGQATGVMNLVAALAGVPLGVWVSQTVQDRLGREAPVAAVWILLAVGLPFVVLAPLAPTGVLALIGLGAVTLVGSAATVITPVVFTSSAPPHLRARMIAASNLCFGVVGASFGPVAYGAFTDQIVGDPKRLFITMSVLSGGLVFASILPLVLADRRWLAVRKLAVVSTNP